MDNNNQQQTPIPMVYYPYNVKKEYKPVDKKDIVFMLLFLLSAFFMVCFGLWGLLHLGFTIAYFVLFGVTTAYLYKKANPFAIVCGLLSLAGAVTFTLSNDFFINAIMLFLIVALYVAYSMGISDNFNSNQGSFRMLFDLLKGTTDNVFDSFSDVFGGIKATAKLKKKSLGGLIGFIVAIPALIIIIPLLVNSDAAFEGLVLSIGKNVGITILQIIIAAVITPVIFTFAFDKRNQLNKEEEPRKRKKGKASVSACVSFLSVISVVYVAYLFSQLAYFFSAFKGILPDNYEHTASAFARRGFFEMFAICVINVIIVSAVSMLARKKSLPIKLLSCFISLFSVLMIAIALRKMQLNVSIYGLSKNRVMVTAFMLMLLVALMFFIIHIFVPKLSYMQPLILICSVMFIALSFSNVDARIAEYNINAYESGKIQFLDIEAISHLSDSATPSLVGLMDNENKDIAKLAAIEVAEVYKEKKSFEDEDFRGFNVAKNEAYKAVTGAHNKLLDNIIKITEPGDEFYYDEDADEYVVEFYDGDYETGDYEAKVYGYDDEQGIYVRTEAEQ